MTMHHAVWMLPPNCAPELGRIGGERCPHCGQWHLREGYCQALDKRRAAPRTFLYADSRTETAKPELVAVETLSTLDETDTAIETAIRCVVCGDPFQARRADARYCSAACRLKAHRNSAGKG